MPEPMIVKDALVEAPAPATINLILIDKKKAGCPAFFLSSSEIRDENAHRADKSQAENH